MPKGFQGVEDLRQVQWSNQLYWDVNFITPKLEGETPEQAKKKGVPYPFSEWFPALSVDDQTADLESYTLETPVKPLTFPKHGGKKTIKLTFVDDAAHLLHQFFDTWIEDTIQNHEHHIATIQEAVKMLEVRRLDHRRRPLPGQTHTYLVYPESPIVYIGSDRPDPNSYSVTFVKVGKVPPSGSPNHAETMAHKGS